MPDIRIVQKGSFPEAITLDFLQTPSGLLDETMQLQTAVIIALGTDRLANPDDELPGLNDDNRRGWWGDYQAEEIWGGWPIGWRGWLLERAKITDKGAKQGSTVSRVENYIREALQPFLEKKIATKMGVSAARTGVEDVDALATLYRGPLPDISLEFQSVWSEISA